MPIASKLLKAIEAQFQADQGASFRMHQREALADCEDAYQGQEDKFRSHLGASQIGELCTRKLWYSFRWAAWAPKEGRLLRLWNRGHLEEGRFIAMLKSIGVQVWSKDAQGKQFRISHTYGHAGGSCDGVSLGVPDCPQEPLLNEFKTHKHDSFVDLTRKGMKDSKPGHYRQMMQYMAKLGLRWGLYGAVDKDTDAIHFELVPLDEAIAQQDEQRSGQIVFADVAPQRISSTATFWECKFCDFRGVCHYRKMPERNCRTCYYSQPVDGGWNCNFYRVPIDKAVQLRGCDSYVKHPEI